MECGVPCGPCAVGAPRSAEALRAKLAALEGHSNLVPAPWSPVALGLLLAAAPPVGLSVLWSSPAYDRETRLALTLTTTAFMAMVTLVAVFALAR